MKYLHAFLACTAAICLAPAARAVSSAELYTATSYAYGRIEARIQFAAGDGVVSSFFMWKDGSEMADVFWNELDFEKLNADCHLETNALYGLPERSHNQSYDSDDDLCGDFHTYMYEWTPDYIAWFIDGVEVRRETGDAALAFSENAASGMQIRFNIWPGDATFGGNFDPAILPVHQYINWVQYYSYTDGAFALEWREDFAGNTRPSGWLTGSWGSPKNLSTHAPANVSFVDGFAVLSLTADDATGYVGAAPVDSDDVAPMGTAGTPVQPSANPSSPPPSPTNPSVVDPGAGGPSPVSDDGDDEGSGCLVGGSPAPNNRAWLAVGLSLIAIGSRRRVTIGS